jgi:hypothetical protein
MQGEAILKYQIFRQGFEAGTFRIEAINFADRLENF